MFNKRLAQTTLLTVFCLSLISGVALARRISYSNTIVTILSVMVALLCCQSRSFLSLGIVTVAGVLLGLGRGQTFMRYSDNYQQLFRKPVTIVATADTDAIYGTNSQLSFDASHLVVQPGDIKLVGKIKVEGTGMPMVYRGDRLQISGSLSATKGSAQGKSSFAKLRLIRKGNSWLDNLRRKFIAGMQSAVPEPEASFGAGLLLGQRSTIPKDVNEQLSTTGLTHLVAVSGYNLTIIIMAARKLLSRGSKFQSTLAASTLMLAFVLLTGLSASIVRAAMVSSLSILAWYYGRQFKPVLLIMLTAAVTTAWNPFYLWSDIGWYLSYLAFFGVLVIAPITVRIIGRGKPPKLVGGLLAETISAQLMTMPIIMYIFGRVSNISLVANVMVVPLVPVAMLLTLVGGFAGMIVPGYAGWIAWPANLLLTYMLDITGLFSKLPHAAAEHMIDLPVMLAAYLTILASCHILSKIFARKSS